MSTEPLLRVSSVQVEGLFDQFDHRVDLEPNERVTILHGPNGVGKTMLLRMVNDLLRGRYNLFLKVPFRRFALTLTDGSGIDLAISHPSQATVGPSKKLKLSLLENGKQKEPYEFSSSNDVLSRMEEALAPHMEVLEPHMEALTSHMKAMGPFMKMARPYMEELVSRGEVPASQAEALRLAHKWLTTGEINDLMDTEQDRMHSELKWLKVLRDSVAVHLIDTQRLLRPSAAYPSSDQAKPRTIHRVLDDARDLYVRINDTMARYGQQSQRLDQSFPQRLLTSPPPTLSVDDLKTRMEELDSKRAGLKKIGLLDKLEDHPFDPTTLDSIEPASQGVMSLYVQDTSDKLEVLTDLARRTRLLLDNVNHKFLHKRIRIDREAGLVAERDDGTSLELEALSSGEQHELVLHYDLLFRVRPNTLVLIDEPELSLHVAWQKRFLPDLLKIVATAKFDVLMATHSPYIVGDRSDLMIGLGEDPA